MSTVLQPYEPQTRSLDELARLVRHEHQEVRASLERSLRHAIAAGEFLREAKPLVCETSFAEWVEEECGINASSATNYMRLAFYQEILPDGVNPTEAIAYLKGLPAADGRRCRWDPVPDQIKAEAKKLRREGKSYNQIGLALGVGRGTVWHWLNPGKRAESVLARRQRERRMKRDAERERRRQEAERAARLRGGSVAKAYTLVRQLAKEIDAAIAQEEDPVAKSALKDALSRAYKAEDQIHRALVPGSSLEIPYEHKHLR